jgi:hypothetical protein
MITVDRVAQSMREFALENSLLFAPTCPMWDSMNEEGRENWRKRARHVMDLLKAEEYPDD